MSKFDNTAFIQKIIQAKKMEVEALMSLLPETAQDHMKVIGKELTSMLAECLTDKSSNQEESQREKSKNQPKSGIRKVGIE